MDVRERGKVLPHVDHVDGHRFVVEPPREQPFVGITRGRLLLDGYRRFEGHLSKILPEHPDHVGTGLVLGSSVGGNSTGIQGSSRSLVGSRDGGRFLQIQRDEIFANDHQATETQSRLGENRKDLEVHETSDHQSVASTRGRDLDVEAEREQRVQLRDAEDDGSAQVSSSSEEKLLNVDRGRFGRHAGWIAAEPWQRRVSGESTLLCCLAVVS